VSIAIARSCVLYGLDIALALVDVLTSGQGGVLVNLTLCYEPNMIVVTRVSCVELESVVVV
jgi:hypothetical protein